MWFINTSEIFITVITTYVLMAFIYFARFRINIKDTTDDYSRLFYLILLVLLLSYFVSERDEKFILIPLFAHQSEATGNRYNNSEIDSRCAYA